MAKTTFANGGNGINLGEGAAIKRGIKRNKKGA
jgi:hypothetical protein